MRPFSKRSIRFGSKTACGVLSTPGPMTISKSRLAQSRKSRRSSLPLAPKVVLQYLFRNAGRGFPGFTRKVSVRSVGENTSQDVVAYIASQVEKESFD